jgi:hypothetical protein
LGTILLRLLTETNRNTVNRYYWLFREWIAAYQEEQAQLFTSDTLSL